MAVNQDDYAIVVGIDNYLSLPPLEGATQDATRFAEWLQDPDGGSLQPIPERIALILSSEQAQSPKPIEQQIDDALTMFKINSRGRLGRRLYFYFSGHGYGQYDDIGMFMPPASINRANYNVGLKPYKLFLGKWGFFDEIIFILDCCRDPIYFAKTQEPSFSFPDHLIPNPAPKVENFVVLATDHGREAFSAWNPETGQKRGILTQALLEGLKEQLATDEKGRITASSLRHFVKRRVLQIAKHHGLIQEAEIIPCQDEIIFNTDIRKMQEIGIQTPPGINELTIRNAKLKTIARYTVDAVSGNWNFEYLVQGDLQKFVEPSATLPGNNCSFKVHLIQNARYAFEVPGGEMYPIDLRDVDTGDATYVFKFE